ncbi:MAG: protease inhibitor I42 family protein [Actinomycetota bacterium]|nr:protease inhibitor I42 family protein [Actinomycetota bacterium]
MPERIRATTAQPFEVDLDAVPTAGYVWSVEDLPGELSLVDDRVRPAGEAIGGSAKQTLVFRASSPGKYLVPLRYGRPWEAEPEQRLVVEIDVD